MRVAKEMRQRKGWEGEEGGRGEGEIEVYNAIRILKCMHADYYKNQRYEFLLHIKKFA